MNWEYIVVPLWNEESSPHRKTLDEWGAEGWEAVSIVTETHGSNILKWQQHQVLMKRSKPWRGPVG